MHDFCNRKISHKYKNEQTELQSYTHETLPNLYTMYIHIQCAAHLPIDITIFSPFQNDSAPYEGISQRRWFYLYNWLLWQRRLNDHQIHAGLLNPYTALPTFDEDPSNTSWDLFPRISRPQKNRLNNKLENAWQSLAYSLHGAVVSPPSEC